LNFTTADSMDEGAKAAVSLSSAGLSTSGARA
jgi:hypothetical protein